MPETGWRQTSKRFAKALAGRTMGTELTCHLGQEKHNQGEKTLTNRRNGKTAKELRTGDGPMSIKVPRDREGSFEPQVAPKHQRESKGFNDKILSKSRAEFQRSRPAAILGICKHYPPKTILLELCPDESVQTEHQFHVAVTRESSAIVRDDKCLQEIPVTEDDRKTVLWVDTTFGELWGSNI